MLNQIQRRQPATPMSFVGDDRKLALHELAVRHHDLLAIARENRGEAPLDLDHAPGNVVELDPVADLQRVVELQREAAEDVAERILHREGESTAVITAEVATRLDSSTPRGTAAPSPTAHNRR